MSEMLQLNDEPHLVAEADQTLGPFPFLRLPAEIRNQIYRLCLCFPAGELARLRRLTTRNHLSAYLLPPLGLVPGLLATCRQLRTEARPLLYQANTFCAHPRLLTSMPFLVDRSRPVLQATAAAHISHWYLGIRLDCEAGFGKEEAAKAFTGADTLEIECWQTMFAMADLSVLKLFDGIRGVQGRAGDG